MEPEVNILDHETLMFVKQTLIQCQDWLVRDARFAHAESKVKIVDLNVREALGKLKASEDKYSDNTNIVNQFIRAKNKE